LTGEVHIFGNKAAISIVVDQMQTRETNRDSKVTLLIEALHRQIQQINELQADCATLKQTVSSMVSINTMAKLSIGSSSTKEDKIVQ
jgi:hypothetical protein